MSQKEELETKKKEVEQEINKLFLLTDYRFIKMLQNWSIFFNIDRLGILLNR